MPHARKEVHVSRDISPHLIPRLVQILAFSSVVGMYLLIALDGLFILFYLPLALVAGRLFFPLLSLVGVFVIACAMWIPGTLMDAFLIGQALIALGLMVCGRLAPTALKSGLRARVMAISGRWIRLTMLVTVIILVSRQVLIRNDSTTADLAWVATLFAFLWSVPWPPPSRIQTWREKAANWSLLAASVCISLAGLELAARVLFPAPPVARPGQGGFQTDRDALFTLQPGWSDTYASHNEDGSARRITVTISSQGLRERELGPKKPDEFRILALGDSFTMGWGVNADETFTHFLEQRLNAQGLSKHFTVINAGVGGYGPWQERIFLEKRGLPLEPDMVLLQVYPENDVGNSLTRIGKHLEAYNPVWERLVLYWRGLDDWRMQADWWLLAHCRLYSRYMVLTGHAVNLEEILRRLRWFSPPRHRLLESSEDRPFYLEVLLDQWYPTLEEGWRVMSDDLRNIQSLCREQEIGLFAFCLPVMHELDDAQWKESLAFNYTGDSYERFKDVRLCEAFFEEAGIPYVNVAEALINDGEPLELYLPDAHLNPEGNRVLADTLCAALTERVLPEYGIETGPSRNSATQAH